MIYEKSVKKEGKKSEAMGEIKRETWHLLMFDDLMLDYYYVYMLIFRNSI